MSEFTGFPVAALDFYDDLEVDNTRSFWDSHKGTYDYSVRRPMVALCAALAPEFGEAKEVLMVEYSAAPVTICFNAQYVLDFLSVVETDSIGLEFKDEMSQAVMKPIGAEGYDYTYVIMPMRV